MARFVLPETLVASGEVYLEHTGAKPIGMKWLSVLGLCFTAIKQSGKLGGTDPKSRHWLPGEMGLS